MLFTLRDKDQYLFLKRISNTKLIETKSASQMPQWVIKHEFTNNMRICLKDLYYIHLRGLHGTWGMVSAQKKV